MSENVGKLVLFCKQNPQIKEKGNGMPWSTPIVLKFKMNGNDFVLSKYTIVIKIAFLKIVLFHQWIFRVSGWPRSKRRP